MRYKLGEIATFSQGKQVDINDQLVSNKDGTRRFVRIIDYTNPNEPPRYVSNYGDRYYVSDKEVAMIRYGSQTAGKVVMGKNGIIANNLFKITINNQKASNKYVYYYLSQKTIFDYLRNTQSSSTMPAISFNTMSNLEIELPPIAIQDRIVRILSSLDEKIELNNRQNRLLLNIALSIYKNVNSSQDDSWDKGFIDDKRLTRICKSGVDIFTGEKKYIATANVDGTDINNYELIKYAGRPSRANMTPAKNTVWFAKMEGSVKNILVADFCDELINTYVLSTGFMGIECLDDSIYYIWCYINDDQFLDVKNSLSTGTLMAGISNTTIRKAEYLIPPHDLLLKFNKTVEPIFKKIYSNTIEAQRLKELRDNLLPKLMSGEISLERVTVDDRE